MLLTSPLDTMQENHFLKWNGAVASDWLLLSLTGSESISTPYSFDIRSMTTLNEKGISEMYGQKVSCRIGHGSHDQPKRYIHGVVTHIQRDLQTGEGKNSLCVLRIEPSFALLRMGRSMRVWQNITVPDLVKELLSERGISQLDIRLHNTYQEREYCIQYRESDFDFISRLLEEEGIYYFFLHSAQQHKMVLADQPSSHSESSSSLIRWHHQRLSLPEGNVYNWKSMSHLIPGEVVFSGYNMQQAATITGQSVSKSEANNVSYIAYTDMEPLAERSLLFSKAKTKMEAFDTNTSFYTADTSAYWLSCGEVFTLTEHPEYNDSYRIQALTINASNNFEESIGGYQCEIQLLRHSVNWRPVCTRTPPEIAGVLTAKVVGPDGEDIHTDEFGRIKVKFHWDQKSKSDGTGSCWVRVSQPWSGNMFGLQFIPRVGSEVLVGFIQGNPDYPLVTGSVYNGQNKPPFTLPDDKFESGFVSRSTNGSMEEGHRLSFNDKKGEEQLTIYAQKDYQLTVQNDATSHVKHEVNNTVGENRNTTINNGNDTLELKSGNYKLMAKNGEACIDAGKAIINCTDSIELKVGSSEITISPGGITIKGEKISIKGNKVVDLGGEISTNIEGKIINIG